MVNDEFKVAAYNRDKALEFLDKEDYQGRDPIGSDGINQRTADTAKKLGLENDKAYVIRGVEGVRRDVLFLGEKSSEGADKIHISGIIVLPTGLGDDGKGFKLMDQINEAHIRKVGKDGKGFDIQVTPTLGGELEVPELTRKTLHTEAILAGGSDEVEKQKDGHYVRNMSASQHQPVDLGAIEIPKTPKLLNMPAQRQGLSI